VVDRLMGLCGEHLQSVWKVRLTADEAPALTKWLSTSGAGGTYLGDLLHSPDDREERLHAVTLLVARGTEIEVAPPDDFTLVSGDELLLVGWPSARRLLDSTLLIDATAEYVLKGRHVPSSWVWRTLSRRPA
jgi:voltage-gated potassium channel